MTKIPRKERQACPYPRESHEVGPRERLSKDEDRKQELQRWGRKLQESGGRKRQSSRTVGEEEKRECGNDS